jgi:hypothetical protein
VGHGCEQSVVALVLRIRWGLCVFRLPSRLRHSLASQILLFGIFYDVEAVLFGRDPCGEVNSLIDDGMSQVTHIQEHLPTPSIA